MVKVKRQPIIPLSGNVFRVAIFCLPLSIAGSGCVSGLWQPVKPWYKQDPGNSTYPNSESYDALGTEIVDPTSGNSSTSAAHSQKQNPVQSGLTENARAYDANGQLISSGEVDLMAEPAGRGEVAIGSDDLIHPGSVRNSEQRAGAARIIVADNVGDLPRIEVREPGLSEQDAANPATGSIIYTSGSGTR